MPYSLNFTGQRMSDIIADKLSTSLSTYLSAPKGTYVRVTQAEWNALKTITNSGVAGQQEAESLYSTTQDWSDLGISFTATTSATNSAVTKSVPANNYVFGFSFKSGPATTSRRYYLGLGTPRANTGFAAVGNGASQITNTAREVLYFVIKGGFFVSTEKDICAYGGSFAYALNSSLAAGHVTWWGNGAITTTSMPNAWTYSIFVQALYEPTGNFQN